MPRIPAGPGLALVAAIIAGGTIGPTAPARAATIAVTTTVDELDGVANATCSMREAVRSANLDTAIGGCAAGSGVDAIAVPAGVYRLTSGAIEDQAAAGDLDLTAGVVVTGAGVADTVVVAEGGDRAFEARAPVTLGRLAIRGGTVATPPLTEHGGAISVEAGGTLALQDVLITGGFAGNSGGGLAVLSGSTATLVDSSIVGNVAVQGGGGVFSDGTLTLLRSTVEDNLATGGAGGGLLSRGTATLTTATFAGNEALGDAGGAVATALAGTLSITAATLSGNTAGTDGGAIRHASTGPLSLTNTTLSGNVTLDDGGGLLATSGSLTLNNVTIHGNVADADDSGVGDGGGLAAIAPATAAMRNSILAGNRDAGGEAPECAGILASQGHNLVRTSTGCTFAVGTGDLVGSAASPVDPLLKPLADNGGPTATHALGPGSPAVDAGSPGLPGSGGAACAAIDQRELPRGFRCDIGAYEAYTCLGVQVNRLGTAGPDAIIGTDAPDGFLTFGGNDVVDGAGGNDAICAGAGNDTLIGGDGDDGLDGGPGIDTINVPGAASLLVDLRAGVATGRGADRVVGVENARGTPGADVLLGTPGSNRLQGFAGGDRLVGRRGRDTLIGGAGNDRMNGGPGRDVCSGQKGRDTAVRCEVVRSAR